RPMLPPIPPVHPPPSKPISPNELPPIKNPNASPPISQSRQSSPDQSLFIGSLLTPLNSPQTSPKPPVTLGNSVIQKTDYAGDSMLGLSKPTVGLSAVTPTTGVFTSPDQTQNFRSPSFNPSTSKGSAPASTPLSPTSSYSARLAGGVTQAPPNPNAQYALQEQIKQAYSLHQQQKYDEARKLYTNLLSQYPRHTTLTQLRSLLEMEEGKLKEAHHWIDQSIATIPDNPHLLFQKALIYKKEENYPQYLAYLDKTIAYDSQHHQAYLEAGLYYSGSKNYLLAIKYLKEAVRTDPTSFSGWRNYGFALKESGQLEAAVDSYAKALELNPSSPDANNNMGNALCLLKRNEEAYRFFNVAIASKPDYVGAYNNRGNALRELTRFSEAIADYETATKLDPNYADAWTNLASTYSEIDQYDQALECQKKSLSIHPNNLDGLINMAFLYYRLGELSDSLKFNQRALEIDPQSSLAIWNKSVALLMAGRFSEGWPIYEHRWDINKYLKCPYAPLWLGKESLKNKTILLYAEQGHGDTIQFARYATMVAELGAKVILYVQPGLISVLNQIPGVWSCEEFDPLWLREESKNRFDYATPLLSLPLAFNTHITNIPLGKQNYLAVNKHKLAFWQNKLGAPTKPRIGIVWSGSPTFKLDKYRSIPLQFLINHFLVSNFQYICLQKVIRDSDKMAFQQSSIVDTTEHIEDFSDTAALCKLMDLVISIDTGVVHLSAAMGCETWVMTPFSPDWRWLLDRTDSLWYPCIRLWRQDKSLDWKLVFNRINQELAKRFG
ncbi:MAG: tetratricopeptide repeat-containing glycosyltransferase family protein, partial [Gammaproteobacteria bacterium]|nr:tetratricopeptide repeat-containing glycosyltransferase family protein [Gammaproteobacteria bacterium]